MRWLSKLLDNLRNWMRANEQAHARAKPHACCSAPPPGAGHPHADKHKSPH